MNDVLEIFDPYPDKRSIKNSLIYEKLINEGLVIKIDHRNIKKIKEQEYKIYDLKKGIVKYYSYEVECNNNFSHNFKIDIVKNIQRDHNVMYYKNILLNVENIDYYFNNELIDLDFFSINYGQDLFKIDFDQLTYVSFYSYNKVDFNDIEFKICLKKHEKNIDLLFLNNSLEYLNVIKKEVENIVNNNRFIIYNEFDYYQRNIYVSYLNQVGITAKILEDSYTKIYQTSLIKDMFYITQLKLAKCMYKNIIKKHDDILSDYNSYIEHEEKIINQLLNKNCIIL